MFDAEHRGAPRLTRVPQVRALIYSLDSFRIRTSANPRSQALYNLYLQMPPATTADKEVTSLIESTGSKNPGRKHNRAEIKGVNANSSDLPDVARFS
jgi:hypothetical protein